MIYFKDWSCTKRAPQPRNECAGGWRGDGRGFISMVEVRTQALTMLVIQLSSAEILNGIGQIHWHIFIDIYIFMYIYIYTQSYTCQCFCKVKQDTFCRNLCTSFNYLWQLVTTLTILHISFSTKARHFRVRGRYVLDKVKRLDSYKKSPFQAFSKYNTCFSNGSAI